MRARGEASLSSVNGDLSTLLDVIEGADAKPTAATVAAVEEVSKTLSSQLARWNEVKTRDVPALNRQLRRARLPAVAIADSSPRER